jgi:hypothetical protein
MIVPEMHACPIAEMSINWGYKDPSPGSDSLSRFTSHQLVFQSLTQSSSLLNISTIPDLNSSSQVARLTPQHVRPQNFVGKPNQGHSLDPTRHTIRRKYQEMGGQCREEGCLYRSRQVPRGYRENCTPLNPIPSLSLFPFHACPRTLPTTHLPSTWNMESFPRRQ